MTPSRPRVVVAAELVTRFSREIFRGIVSYARQHTNWKLMCHTIIDFSDYRAANADGMLTLSADDQIGIFARETGVPAVRIGNANTDPYVSAVSVDERGIGELAAEHFAGLGLKNYAFVSHGDWPFVAARRDNFVRSVEALGFGPVHQLGGVLDDPKRRGQYEKRLEELLKQLPRPCGLLAANDSLGVMIVEYCRGMGLRVPEDVAIVGVDDDELACELSEVPLSSVAQPLTAIGYEAARLLHQHLDNPSLPPTQLLLPPLRVVPRASSDLIAMDDGDVVAALRLINENAADAIDVNWLIRRLPVARRSLERKFKAMVGRTILEQIHHVRFQKAKELLAESDLSLDMVAQRAGFSNARWMADKFRKELRTTPNRFRKQFRLRS